MKERWGNIPLYISIGTHSYMAKCVKLREVGDSLVVTIPRSVADALGWVKGDIIQIEVSGVRSLSLVKK